MSIYRKHPQGFFELNTLGGKLFSAQDIIDQLLKHLTPHRREKLTAVTAQRSHHLIAVLDNIYDEGNVQAVIRSSESFGLFQLGRVASLQQKATSRISCGAHKWVQITNFSSTCEAIEHYQNRGYQVAATSLDKSALALEQVDFSRPTALLFGNEADGISSQARERCDFSCIIPTSGFTQSLNISVAAGIAFHHAQQYFARYSTPYLLSPPERKQLLAHYLLHSFAHPEKLLALPPDKELTDN